MSSITKPEFWLVSLTIVIIISMALLIFGNALDEDPNISLDDDSKEYLETYSKEVSVAGIETQANTSLTNTSTENPILKWLSGTKIVQDTFGLFTAIANIVSGLWDFFKMAFNLPSFFINTLGIETLGNIKYIINSIGTMLFLGIIILLVRITK